jgi:peptidoglycan/LPS O-acetylase OafA/YrhL
MITASCVVFWVRVAPNYNAFDESEAAQNYQIFRIIAMVTMFLLNTFQSAIFEFQNRGRKKVEVWETSPTWKLGALSFIALLSCSVLMHNVLQDKSADIRQKLHNVQDRNIASATTNTNPSATSNTTNATATASK